MEARKACELLHFAFLERLVRTSAPRLYVLKGGVNLRFFLGSPRYSEDMDLDVAPAKVGVETLRKNGYRILQDPAFLRSLRTANIDSLELGDPEKAKHTETTQRFRLNLVLSSGLRVPTKIEFSRRGVDMHTVETARIDPEVARRHQRLAFSCDHYRDDAAARQKLEALADRVLPQARDVFDLDLLSGRGVELRSIVETLEPATRAAALDNLMTIDYGAYRDQVVEYLEEDARDSYGSKLYFEGMQARLLESFSS